MRRRYFLGINARIIANALIDGAIGSDMSASVYESRLLSEMPTFRPSANFGVADNPEVIFSG
jgi:hypothetical protein